MWRSSWFPIWRPYDDNVHIVKQIPRAKEPLFSFQSAIRNETQSNVKHMAAILKSNMAALGVNSDIAKMFLDIENIGIDTWISVLGAIGQEATWYFYGWNDGRFGVILEINMAATRGRTLLGYIVFMIYRYYRTILQSFMLSSKTELCWCSAAPLA